MLDTLLKLDGDILLWIQDNLRAGWLDPIMKFITYLANGGALWIGICVLLLILKKTRTTGIVCSCSLAVTFLINNIILKNIIARTRPYEVVEGLNRIIGAQSDFSFPSGHSGASFAVAVVMFMEMPKKYVAEMFCDRLAATYSGNTHCVLTAVCWCTLSIRRYRRRSNGNDICCYNSGNIQKILQGQETF